MKWTIDYVWEKVESVIPNARSFGYVLPEALKAAAVEMFINEQSTIRGDWTAYVISECIKEIKCKGYLESGSISEDWK